MCGKVAITEQRARPTTSPIHRRAQVCNAVVVVVDVVVDVVVVDVDVADVADADDVAAVVSGVARICFPLGALN